MKTENYMSQHGRWPQTGRHIMAQYDDHGIIVYQAYRPAIGRFAAQCGLGRRVQALHLGVDTQSTTVEVKR